MGIMLIKGFKDMELGKDRLVSIKKVNYDKDFDTCRLTFIDEEGGMTTEFFTFVTGENTPNEVALGIFSNIAKAATGDNTNREIDPNDLVGLSLIADVYEREGKNKDGTPNGKLYRHLRNFRPSDVELVDEDEDEEDLFD